MTATADTTTAAHGAGVYAAPAMSDFSPAAEWGAPLEHTPAFAPDLETDDPLRFEDEDGPLKMVDYSVPFTDDLLPLSSTSSSPIIAAPPPIEMAPPADAAPSIELAPSNESAPSAGMPTLATPSFDASVAEPGDADGDFTSTLRMSREELTAAFAPPQPTGIPIVAPFVLDTPLVSPATVETPPRLVVRMGRLSAAFDLVKEVTIIGRPDSEMHYYPDVEIDLDDAVSRRHAEIIRRDSVFSIVDTGSTNGTLLNGEALLAHEERPLAHGDRIRVGERTEIIFE